MNNNKKIIIEKHMEDMEISNNKILTKKTCQYILFLMDLYKINNPGLKRHFSDIERSMSNPSIISTKGIAVSSAQLRIHYSRAYTEDADTIRKRVERRRKANNKLRNFIQIFEKEYQAFVAANEQKSDSSYSCPDETDNVDDSEDEVDYMEENTIPYDVFLEDLEGTIEPGVNKKRKYHNSTRADTDVRGAFIIARIRLQTQDVHQVAQIISVKKFSDGRDQFKVSLYNRMSQDYIFTPCDLEKSHIVYEEDILTWITQHDEPHEICKTGIKFAFNFTNFKV